MSSTNTINPKPCNYGCGTRIYWNTSTNENWEVFTKKKYICSNSINKKSVTHINNNYNCNNKANLL